MVNNDEDCVEFCYACSGSGEGQTDGVDCSFCKGRGVLSTMYPFEDDTEPPEPTYA